MYGITSGSIDDSLIGTTHGTAFIITILGYHIIVQCWVPRRNMCAFDNSILCFCHWVNLHTLKHLRLQSLCHLHTMRRDGRFMNIAYPNEDLRVHTSLMSITPIGNKNEWCDVMLACQWREVKPIKELVAWFLAMNGDMSCIGGKFTLLTF